MLHVLHMCDADKQVYQMSNVQVISLFTQHLCCSLLCIVMMTSKCVKVQSYAKYLVTRERITACERITTCKRITACDSKLMGLFVLLECRNVAT